MTIKNEQIKEAKNTSVVRKERILDMIKESMRAGHAVTHTYCDNPQNKKIEIITVKACYVDTRENFKEEDKNKNRRYSIVSKSSFNKKGTKITNVKAEVLKNKVSNLEEDRNY